ncbi:hypothetical protein [Micromonospora sp. DT31]|uniref:Rv0361 family membrane protein n=1 Tax=Micromonospora sp. DT31 TaxID=3393434 RepID=UPI003CE8B5F8
MTYPPAAVPPKKSKRTLFIVLGVVLAVCCSGAALGGFLLFRTVQEATGPARTTVDAFAGALVERDYPAAYRHLCSPLRDRVSEADFAAQGSARPDLTDHEIVGLNVSNNNGRVSGSATVRYTPDVGAATTEEYPLVKEDGEWRICQ